MKRKKNDELRQLRHPDDRTVQEIAEQVPVLDDAAIDRIDALCERKLSERMNTTMRTDNMTFAAGVEKITRTQWFRPVTAAAACLLIAAGIAGGTMLGGKMPSENPLPSVNSRNEDDTAAPAGTEETAQSETAEGKTTIVTETVVSEVTETGTTAASSETTTAAQTEQETASHSEEAAIPPALSVEQLRTLFDQNVRCLEHFVLTGLGTQNEPLDGAYIYEVASSEYASYEELESFVYSTYTDSTANQILTNFPLNGAMYLEYDGKLCMDTYYALGGLSYEIIWADYQISNPAAVDADTITFDVTADTVYGESVSYTCRAVREADGWRLEELYGYEKVEQDLPEKPDAPEVRIEDTIAELIAQENAVGVFAAKSEPIDGTTLYEVDFDNMVYPEPYFWDYASFADHIYATYTPVTAEWVLHDSIFAEVDGKLCIDMAKANTSAYTILVPDFEVQMTWFGEQNDCTFEIAETTVPFSEWEAERLSGSHTAIEVEGLGWRLSECPTFLLK